MMRYGSDIETRVREVLKQHARLGREVTSIPS
jgi:hypothetical protein